MANEVKKGRPITPDEVVPWKEAIVFPPEVFDAINGVIAKHWNGDHARFTTAEVVDAIVAATTLTREQVFERHYLDFEPVYRKAGWKVAYDRPGYNESYEANFTFRKK